MVSTRHSLPGGSDDALVDEDDANSTEKKVKLALRKLQIDGTEALKGESVSRRNNRGVYHYRGAVYDITDDTPQEWIDRQPERYKRSESRGASLEVPESARSRSQKRVHIDVDESEEGELPAKRTRKSMPAQLPARTENITRMSTRSTAAQAVPRSRRLMVDVENEPHQSQRGREYLKNGGEDILARIEAARLEARQKGYNVDPIPKSSIAAPNRRPGIQLAHTLMKLAKLNGRLAELRQQYQTMRENGDFDALIERTKTGCTGADAGESKVQNQSARMSPSPTRLERSVQQQDRIRAVEPSVVRSMSSRTEMHNETRPVSNGKRQAESSENGRWKRHDSASSLSISTPPTTAAVDPTMPSKDQLAATRATAPLAERVDQRRQSGRAEQAISSSLREGEDQASRHERLRREYAILRAWPIINNPPPRPRSML